MRFDPFDPACRRPDARLEYPPAVDWRGAEHVGRAARPCRWCRGKTRLVDEHGEPAHKVCHELAAAEGRVAGIL